MSFDPSLCRNESEVESKLIVQYLLPKLGYSPDTWHQEVTFGAIRLDFLAFATQVIPFVLDANSPLSVVMEAKHPNQNLNNHVRRLQRYLTSLNVRYGLLTNGKQIRIYERIQDELRLVFQCPGQEVDARLDEIKALIGRDSSQENPTELYPETNPTLTQPISTSIPEKKSQHTMKIIAVYHNKGGVGKTTTVVNLAAAIAKKGKKVLVIDLDSQANTTFATGLIKFDDEQFDDIKDSNIRHVLESEDFYPIQEVARKSQFSNPEINVVPSHINLMNHEKQLSENVDSSTMLIRKLDSAKNEYDIVLIDTPPSLNLYAKIALITADYLIIPSDLKPFANQGLINVKDFMKRVNGFRKMLGKIPIEVLGVLACKISTNARFVQSTLQKRIKAISERYGLEVMDTVIYDRDDLAKCAEKVQIIGDMEIADPVSVLDFKPDSTAAQEFELLAIEVLQKTGMD
ncbi:AAA family ATPase [Allocoleopsis franciscana]|uniref:ATPase involved in chromosome partitioning n=1 Tax=Allocoleopsis franciscana PCC 7113 TaxID=1173027 RepID=K9WHL0_9CYAN|nr:AAA family ATPase [Allocoleopsis franciscana]AFZ19296.1 ATPase involved in chromosome partitioning [Allocoleopsis franciscana PCC 7113]